MSVSSRSVPSELVSESQGESLVSDRRVLVDGVDLQYLEAGSGPPLLLVHGHEQSATSWRWVIPVLARTHRVLALSLPGHGDSAPAVGGYAPGADLAPLVTDFLDTLGVGALHVVGNSIGLAEVSCVSGTMCFAVGQGSVEFGAKAIHFGAFPVGMDFANAFVRREVGRAFCFPSTHAIGRSVDEARQSPPFLWGRCRRRRQRGALSRQHLGQRTWAVEALRCPPLSCRTSPPQGGRLAVAQVFPNRERRLITRPAPPLRSPRRAPSSNP